MAAMTRPAVSVVVPFAGGQGAAERMFQGLSRLRLDDADELIVADNTGKDVVRTVVSPGVTVVRASGERSSYHARNAGAALARGEWILFIDADCAPEAGLIDAYFAELPPEHCGVLAGQIEGDPEQSSLIARYTRSRRFFRQDAGFLSEAGTAATGNLLVRRSAFEAVGGFAEGIRSAGDVDLCRRLRAADWTLEVRRWAVVSHHHRDSLPSLLSAVARYGAGSRWLDQRYPGESRPWPLIPGLVGVARDVPVRLAAGKFEEAAFRVVDAAGLVAHVIGYRGSNRAGKIA